MGVLEKYCEILYRIYECIQGETLQDTCALTQELSQNVQLFVEELKANILSRKVVLFLPVLAKDWDGLHSLWQAAAEDEKCDVYVAPLPYYYKDYDSSAKKICYERAQLPEEVTLLDYTILTPEYLELLHPEVIIIQNPYDAWHPAISVPEMFYAANIRRYTDRLIYVPPFMVDEFTKQNAREYANMKYYVTMPGVVYADAVIVQSENMKQMYIEKLTEFAGEDTREHWQEKILPLGLLIMDKQPLSILGKEADDVQEGMNTEKGHMKKHKKLLYGISSSILQEAPEAAKNKIESNLKIFDSYKEEIEVTLVHFPEESITSTTEYDAYYGDPMPVMMEFVQAGKPVMIQSVKD